jgi:hypothetical protein
MTILKITLRLIIAVIILIVTMHLFEVSTWLMNQPNGFALLGGAVSWLAIAGLALWSLCHVLGVFKFFRKAKATNENIQ